MTPQEKTELSDKRVMAAINMETPDRVPIFMDGQGYFKYIDPTATIADYFRRPKYVDDLLIQAAEQPLFIETDSAPGLGFVSKGNMEMFASMFFAKMKFPGFELPDNSLWNVHEVGPMTEADYDTIIDKGWGYMTQELFKRIGFDPSTLPPFDMDYFMSLMARVAPMGKSTIGVRALLPFPPFEVLSGARKMQNFVRDIRRIPEKVKAAMDIIEDYSVEQTIKALQSGPPSPYGFIGGTRSGSTMISPAVFEKFYFTYYQKVIPAMQKIGVKTWLHNDNDWSGFLHYFREFDKAQCIWDPDHMTGMAKIKEALGDKMCITGDLPPGLTSVGTPEQCYKYVKDQMALMGKTGFIMNTGCSVPIDAKKENMEAAISAALES